MKLDQLPINEYPDFYAAYIETLENVQLLEDLEIALHQFIKFVQNTFFIVRIKIISEIRRELLSPILKEFLETYVSFG